MKSYNKIKEAKEMFNGYYIKDEYKKYITIINIIPGITNK